MDFKTMKRKDLQALCKKNGIPANSTNAKMIESLSSILQADEKVKPKGCLKGSGGSSGEDLGASRLGAKKVSFDVEVDDEESVERKAGAKSKMKSVGKRSGVAPALRKSSKETGTGSNGENLKDASEVPQRTTRSRRLSVMWSPVIEKKKKVILKDGTEGVRCNVEQSSEKEEEDFGKVPTTTRSLRSRVVVASGDEVLATDQNRRRVPKRKSSDEKEESEKTVALSDKKHLGKRPRDGKSVEDELPRRRSGRSGKLEESVDIEEVDGGRSRKRRKGNVEVAAVVEKEVVQEIEIPAGPGRTAKRLRGSSTVSVMDSVVLTKPTRRSTRSSSTAVEDETSLPVSKKSVKEDKVVTKVKSLSQKQAEDSTLEGKMQEYEFSFTVGRQSPVQGKAGQKGKSRRQVKNPGSKRGQSTRSSTLLEDVASLPVVVKPVKENEASKKGRPRKQAKGRALGNDDPITFAEEPTRRSTRDPSKLLEDDAPLPATQKFCGDTEAERKDYLGKQPKVRPFNYVEPAVPLPDVGAVTGSARRATRSASKLFRNEASQGVAKSVYKDNDTDKKDKSEKHVPGSALKQRALTALLPDSEAATTPTPRSTQDSLKFLEEGRSHASEQGDLPALLSENKAETTLARRLRHSSSKVSEDVTGSAVFPDIEAEVYEDNDTDQKDKSEKHVPGSALKQGALTALLPDSEAATTPTSRSAQSSLKFLEEGRSHASEQGDLPALLSENKAETTPAKSLMHSSSKVSEDVTCSAVFPDSETVTTSARRSTHSSSKMSEEISSTPAVGKLVGDTVRKDQSVTQVETRASKGGDSAIALVKIEDSTKQTRSSTQSYMKLVEEGTSHAAEKGDLLASLSVSKAETAPAMRSMCSSSKMSEDVPSTPIVGNFDSDGDTVRKDEFGKQAITCAAEDADSAVPLPDNKTLTESARRSAQSSPMLHLLGDDYLEDEKNLSEEIEQPSSENRDMKDYVPCSVGENIYGQLENQMEFDSIPQLNGMPSLSDCDASNYSGYQSENLLPEGRSLGAEAADIEQKEQKEEVDGESSVKVSHRASEDAHSEVHQLFVSPLTCRAVEVVATNASEASPRIYPEDFDKEVTQDGLLGNEAPGSGCLPVVRKSSDLSLVPDIERSPQIGPENPDLNVEFDAQYEDVIADNKATLSDPMTSDKEVLPEASHNVVVGYPDSEVEVQDASSSMKNTGAITCDKLPLHGKYSGDLSPTLINEASPTNWEDPNLKVDIYDSSKMASHGGCSIETRDDTSKVVEVPTLLANDDRDLSGLRRIFCFDMEGCKADSDALSSAQLTSEKHNALMEFEETPGGDTGSFLSEAGGEEAVETYTSTTLSFTVNDENEADGNRVDRENNGDEVMPTISVLSPGNQVQPSEEICDLENVADVHGTENHDAVESGGYEETTGPCSPSGSPAVGLEEPSALGVDGAVLFESDMGVDEAGEASHLSFSCAEEISFMSGTESCATLGFEGSITQLDTVQDMEGARYLSEKQKDTMHVAGSRTAGSPDKSPKSTPEVYLGIEQPNVVFDGLREAINTVDVPSHSDSGSHLEQVAVVRKKMVNMDHPEEEASDENDDNALMKIADNTLSDEIYHEMEVAEQPNQHFLSHEKDSSGETHTAESASNSSIKYSVSVPAYGSVFPVENYSLATYMANVQCATEKVDRNAERAAGEVEILGGEESEPTSLFPLSKVQEGQEYSSAIANETSSGRGLGLAEQPGALLTGLYDMSGFTLTDEKEVEKKVELFLPCNAHGDLKEEVLLTAAKEANDGCSAEIPLINDSFSEVTAISDKLALPSESGTKTSSIPDDIFECKEARKDKTCTFGGRDLVNKHEEDNSLHSKPVCEDAMKSEECVNSDTCIPVEKTLETGFMESDGLIKGSPVADLPLVGRQELIGAIIEERSETATTDQAVSLGQFDQKISEDGDASGCRDLSETRFNFTSVDEYAEIQNDNAIDVAQGVGSSSKGHTKYEQSNKYHVEFEKCEQTSNVEESWVAPGASALSVEQLFRVDSDITDLVNNAQISQGGYRLPEDFGHAGSGNDEEISTWETSLTGKDDMKALAANFIAESAEACCPSPHEIPFKAENSLIGSLESYLELDYPASNLTPQQKSLGPEANDIIKIEETFSGEQIKDGSKFGSLVSKQAGLNEDAITPVSAVSKKDSAARKWTEISETEVTDQVISLEFGFKGKSIIKEMPSSNKLEYSKLEYSESSKVLVTSQDTEAVRTASREYKITEAETEPHKMYFEDFWSDNADIGSSHHEVQDLTQMDVADDSSKPDNDADKDQNKSSELGDTADEQSVQNTPLVKIGSFKPYSVIDDGTKNKENSVAMKMSALKHKENSVAMKMRASKHKEKSAMSTRRPLQSVRRIDDES